MKMIRIINTVCFFIFLFFSYQIYQRYDTKNKKIEIENQKIKMELENSFPVRQENFYVLQKDAPPRKKIIEVEIPKEELVQELSQEENPEQAQTFPKKEGIEKLEATKAPVVKKEEIKKENKENKVTKKTDSNIPVEKKSKKLEDKKGKKEEVSKAIVIEKKEKPIEKPAEVPKKAAPVVTEIKDVKLPKVTPGEIREIEGTFDPN